MRNSEEVSDRLQHALMCLLAENKIRSLYDLYSDTTQQRLQALLGAQYQTNQTALAVAVWSLIRRGLLYLRFGKENNPIHWMPGLTVAGAQVVKAGDASPHDPQGYLTRLRSKVPTISGVTFRYLEEALASFNEGIYLGATILIGVASESAFLEMAEAFLPTLEGVEASNFEKVLHGPSMFSHKFVEFRKRIEPRKGTLPESFQDGMALHLDTIADLLRRNRNDAGHPTGKPVDKDDCFIALQIAPRYMAKLYGLKEHFETVDR